jgi:hypothetical protein
MEQAANYDIIANWQNGYPVSWTRGFDQDLASSADHGDGFWRNRRHMTEAMRTSLSSVSFMLCPTRRAGRQGTGGDDLGPVTAPRCDIAANGSIVAYGPFSDYAPVIYVSYELIRGTSHPWAGRVEGQDFHHVSLRNTGNDNANNNSMAPDARTTVAARQSPSPGSFNVGPLRRASIPGAPSGVGTSGLTAMQTEGNGRDWIPRDTLSWWRDGTSNQIVIGEKHIPAGAQFGNLTTAWRHDQSFLNAADSNARDWAIGRTVAPTIPLSSPNDGGSPRSQRTFGSWHPGICNFLLGDGSVRAFSVTTSGTILGNWAHANSGQSISL